MGCCQPTNQTALISKEYYDKNKNATNMLGQFDDFSDAVESIQNTHDEKFPGVFILKIKKAVFIQEDECKVYILSCLFSDEKENVYRIVYHKSGLTTVAIQ